MGNAGSVHIPGFGEDGKRTIKIPFEQMIEYVMPIYYTKHPLKPHCKEKLITSWKKIIANKAEGFYEMKKLHPDSTPCSTPMEYFANRFIVRLIEVHPVCGSMFTKSSLKHGTAVMNMISFLIKELENPEATRKQLQMLATSHTKMGIRATEFGIFGEVLFWTLRLVLGKEDYDVITHTAWIKFFSRILDAIVPAVLQHEVDHRSDAHAFNVKRMMPIMDTSQLINAGVNGNDDHDRSYGTCPSRQDYHHSE